MKKIIFILFTLFSNYNFAQTSDYKLNSYLDEGFKAPNTNYLGEAWLNSIIRSDEILSYNLTKATFKANSTLNWHKHSDQQVLIVVDGEGYYQEKGKHPIRIRVGDIIRCTPNTEHWHSSSKESDVTYLAIYNGETEWTEILTKESYDQIADQLRQ